MTLRSRPEGRRTAGALAAAALLLAIWAPAAPAAAGNRQQPASIEADRVEIDRPSGVSRYFGNVVFVQGTLRITGNRLILQAPGGVVRHAEVHGERATIRQQTDTGQTVHARARHIVYEPDNGLATLTGNAELLRDGDRFTAARIEYRPDTGRIDAAGGESGGRVHIRIEPDEQTDQSEPDADSEDAP